MEFPTRQTLLQALDLGGDGILILDGREESLPIVYVNEVAASLYGLDKSTLIGQTWPVLQRDDSTSERMRSAIDARSDCDCLVNGERPDGTRWCRQARVRPLRGDNDECEAIVVHLGLRMDGRQPSVFAEPRSEPARETDASAKRVRSDVRSCLVSFESFREALRRDVAIARRQSLDLSIILFEISDLETYRSTFGVNAADSCMRMIAKQITSVLRRGSDLSAQLDDSKIIAVLVGQGKDEAQSLADQICKNIVGLRLHNPRGHAGRFLSAVPTVVQADPESEDFEDFLARATAGTIVEGLIGQFA